MTKFDLGFVRTIAKREFGDLWKDPNIRDCLDFCFNAHDGQLRETANSSSQAVPYILHPVGVAILCLKFYDNSFLTDNVETIVMAALAHDLLEDTTATPSEINRICGERVTELVSILTKPMQALEEDNQQRNARFSRSIIDGGASSMFIKICDSMHNMSRPQQSPASLMEKAIRKARTDYSKFFGNGLVDAKLKKAYFDQIQVTTTYLADTKVAQSDKTTFELKEVLERAYAAHNKKALEQHDLYSFLENNLLVSFARTINQEHLHSTLIGHDRRAKQQIQKKTETLIAGGDISIDQLPNKVRQDPLFAGIDRLLVFPMSDLISNEANFDRNLVVGVNSDTAPDWVSKESVGVILGYLSEKIRDHARNEFIELARSAADLGLDVGSEELLATKLTYADLLKLRDAHSSAEYLGKRFLTEIERSIHKSGTVVLPLPIEIRVKTPASILKKISTRKLDGLTQVDDLLGIRIICLNDSHRHELMPFCETLARAKATDRNDIEPKFSEVTSAAGYKAHHMTFICEGVGCEIQVRTLFEDAWARVSGAMQYKTVDPDSKNNDLLKSLAALRDQSAVILSKLD